MGLWACGKCYYVWVQSEEVDALSGAGPDTEVAPVSVSSVTASCVRARFAALIRAGGKGRLSGLCLGLLRGDGKRGEGEVL